MALKGLRVLEMAGLAPAPFCGLLLADLGAGVIRVDRPKSTTFYSDRFTRGKQAIAIDLSQKDGQGIFLKLCENSDILIDSYRPGVMESLKIGPREVMKINPRLIYARMSGFGQTGPLSKRPGHDINFLAMSGVLSMLGPKNSKPQPPLNLLGDFGGGGLLCALGILAAVIKRGVSGRGEVLDANITDGTAYLSTWLWRASDLPVWGEGRGTGWFDGGLPWYDTYQCQDDKFVAVGCLEKVFFENLLTGLEIPGKYNQSSNLDEMRNEFSCIFKKKSRDLWMEVFEELDACVTPLLTLQEAPFHPHHQCRRSFYQEKTKQWQPRPSPRPITDAQLKRPEEKIPLEELLHHGQNTFEILSQIGYQEADFKAFLDDQIITNSSLQ